MPPYKTPRFARSVANSRLVSFLNRMSAMTSRSLSRVTHLLRSWMFGAAVALVALTGARALAVGPGGGRPGGGGGGGTGGQGGGGGGGGGTVPEINPNAAVAALTLVGGMTLILTDRLRRRRLADV